MKKHETGARIILIAFFVVTCLSWILYIPYKKYVDSSNNENRAMAERPELTIENYPTFANDFTSYFNDSIPFRNSLITLNNAIDYFVFHRSANADVLVGKNHWLFYSKESDGDPIKSYEGNDLYTDEQLKVIADNCIKQRDFLKEKGKEFVIFIAPNKERVYSEEMPDLKGKPAENYGVLQLYNYLKTNTDLRIVYAYDDLMKAKEELPYNIYYKLDTHWNNIGGYIGTAALLKELGITMPSITSDKIAINQGEHRAGDLANMLNLNSQMQSFDYEYTVDGYDTHASECTEYDFSGMWSFQATGADPRSLYIIRDSFATGMASHIGSQFDKCYMRHRSSYKYKDFKECDPDIVVYETVERYANLLETFSIK